MQNLDDLLVNFPAGFRARIGLNETSLTRALARGEFTEAERIIEEATDIEFLNDGALSATPLNMVLTGRSSYFHQSRNLKLAHLLMQRGANPNLRIPNHDMESASESPLELLLRYYLKLIDVFGLPGSGQCRTSYRPSSFEETELMDTVGLHGEIGGLGPGQITSQARDLLLFCLDHGGDPNLPTTDAARSIFHMTLVAPVIDPGLATRMLEKGANVNLADVHNTTPIMDIISLGDQSRARHWLGLLQPLMLDIENCSLQSGLWRSVFQGHSLLSLDLIKAGAGQSSASRVEMITRPAPRISRHSGIKTTVPALLSPLLSDSPCTAQLHARLPRRRSGQGGHQEFSYHAVSHVCRHCIAPAVDAGQLQTSHVQGLVSSLIGQQTDHGTAGDSAVVDPASLIPLMFGQLGAGLRQLAVRAIMSQILFSCSPEEAQRRLDKACQRQGFMLTQLLVKPTLAQAKTPEEPSMMSYEYEIELGSEMELSFGRMERSRNNGGGEAEGDAGMVLESVELAVSDIGVSDNPPSDGNETASNYSDALDEHSIEDYARQTVSELEDTIANIDREMAVIRTDYELDTLDRDLANLQVDQRRNIANIHEDVNREIATLNRRLENLHEEAESLQSQLGCKLETLEDCEKKEEEILEEQRVLEEQLSAVQRRIRQIDLDDADGDEIHIVSEEISLDTDPTHTNNTTSEHSDQTLSRRWLDENWSLGSDRVLDSGEAPLHPLPHSSVHTETLVRTLTVAANYNTGEAGPGPGEAQRAPRDESGSDSDNEAEESGRQRSHRTRNRRPVPSQWSDTEDSDSDSELSLRTADRERRARPSAIVDFVSVSELSDIPSVPSLTHTDDTDSGDGPVTFRQETRSVEGPQGSRRPQGSSTLPPLLVSSESSLSDTEDDGENSSYDSDTWGGTFSLRHTRTQAEAETETTAVSEASIILRLTPRTLFALTDSVGIPHSLRPLFSIEAARLQLCLALFYHKSISCDRNCEGDESESDDSEEDWLSSLSEAETEEDEQEHREEDEEHEENHEDDGDQNSSSSVSNFSQRSWYGSLPQLVSEQPRLLTPAATPPALAYSSSDTEDSEAGDSGLRGSSSWLEDRDDLIRVRQFLASSPGPDFTHSTDSEED